MEMVTEPLFASVANILGILDNISKLPKELLGMVSVLCDWYAILLISRLRGTEPNHRWMRLVKPDVVF
ncbi:unnamed protein product [Lactuca virosa]|uniref:Uncharacterized protein n=1 Tax=Lactuca virosa TaxID=75947 RepID=A0AAU9PWD4_9ASTR|nr:unnamed protein product [Lactuca virosa]